MDSLYVLKHQLKYDRLSINRKNRDRRGGHQGLLNSFADGVGAAGTSPVENKFAKRLTRKKMRRQHARSLAEGLAQYDQDNLDRCMARGDYDLMSDYEDPMTDREYQDWLAGYPDDREHEQILDGYFDDYVYYPDDPYDLFSNETISEERELRDQMGKHPLDHVVTFDDRGKTLRELLEEKGIL